MIVPARPGSPPRWLMFAACWVISIGTGFGEDAGGLMSLEMASSTQALSAGESTSVIGEIQNRTGATVPLLDLAIFVRTSTGRSTSLFVDLAAPFLAAIGPDWAIPSAGYRGPLLTVVASPSTAPPPASSIRLELTAGGSSAGVAVLRGDTQINFPRLESSTSDGALVLSWSPPDVRFELLGRATSENRVPWRPVTNGVATLAGRNEMRLAPTGEAKFFRLQMR
ncbi:MAG: hypothetical protein JNK85_05740 [Verrucomicrobiales bacterium]|nr:hypothetical protein [Verrucomicrobiales bacterium]